MQHKIIFRLKKVTHTGAHIGRDVEIKISSPLGISCSVKRGVPPEQVTNFDIEIGRIGSDTDLLFVPMSATVVEHDAIFDDVGTEQKTIELNLENEKKRTDTIVVHVTERRWFFWKATARFSVVIETLVESILPEKHVSTVDNPRWTEDFSDDSETILLARVIFGEARNELLSDSARIAVGWSIRNRVEYKNALRYGGTYHAVILKPKQYSSFSVRDKNRYLVEDPLTNENVIDARAWRNCYNIAADILSDRVADPTDGANHFFDDSISRPSWAKQEYLKIKIGSIFFYDIP